MDPQSHFPNPIKIGSKVPIVKLERCDKIWKTLQVIKLMQDKHLEDIANWMKREPITVENVTRKEPPMTFIPDKSLPLNLIGEPDVPTKPAYIKYQPVLTNGNKSMLQFRLAEKRRVNLYHCEVCGKEFYNYKRFSDHQDQLHGIILPKKITARRERKSFHNSLDSEKQRFSQKFVPNENFNLGNPVKTATKSKKCQLCNGFYRDIEKHMAQCHDAGSTEESSNDAFHQNSNSEQAMEIESSDNLQFADQRDRTRPQNGINNSLKRKATAPPGIEIRKKLRRVRNKRSISDSEFQNGQMRCEICHRQFVYYNSLCKHKRKHKLGEDERCSEVKKNELESSDPIEPGLESSAMDKLELDNENEEDSMGRETPLTESSFTKECDKFEDGSNSGKSKTKNKCWCGRLFRNSYILFTHKRNCKFLENIDEDKSTETHIGGDRDSGISIKIKKRNNSYEIVGKEGDGEKGVLCGDISDSSLNISDNSECDHRSGNLVPEESKYSKEHKVLKIKLVDEDIEVNIEDEATRNSERESDSQVLSLRELCKESLVQQGRLPSKKTTHKCQFCQTFHGSEEKLSKHIERHKKLMKRSCTCAIKFSNIQRFEDHVVAKHPDCLICPYCKERYKSIVEWDEHICLVEQGERYTEVYNENHPCPNCNIIFNNIMWLDSHMKSEHLDPELPFQCYQCVEKFPNEIARSVHFHKLHNQTSPCSVCHQKLQSTKTRQKHEAYHRGVGFPCHKCKKTYPSRRSILYHMRSVHNECSNDKMQCFICKKIMKTRSFKKHVLRHNSKLDCKICKKVFYDYRSLERHIMDHHRDEDYPREKCKICGYSFPTEEQLEAHIAVEHTVRNEHKNV